MRISDWSSDVCSSDLQKAHEPLWGCRRRQLLKGGSDGKAGNTGTVSTESACGPCGWCWSMRARTDRYRRRSQSSRSEEHTSELQSLMRISYAVFCLKKKTHAPPLRST